MPKNFIRGAVKNASQRFVLMKGYLGGKIKNFPQEPVFMPFIF